MSRVRANGGVAPPKLWNIPFFVPQAYMFSGTFKVFTYTYIFSNRALRKLDATRSLTSPIN